jgi:hypothetical protein
VRFLLHILRLGVSGLVIAGGCDFDAARNPAYGCDACKAPDRCIDGFCVRNAGAAGAPAQAGAGGTGCEPGTSELCYDGPEGSDQRAPCRSGRKTCSAEGVLGECRGQILPADESCNDLDDDCDGTTDELLMREAQVCVEGRFVCTTPSMSVLELCDGVDNDCDGESDEGYDLDRDHEHCGGCGITCTAAQACCGGACIDLANDERNCGECGKQCSRGTTCCGGACVDTSSDASHCGECGQRCAGAMSCCGGTCVDTQIDRDHCGPFCLNCAAGESCCFGSCADLDSFQHCGSCERVCATDELCCSGNCSATACQ